MWLNQHSSRPLQKYRVRMLVGEVSFLVDQVDLAEPDQDGAASHPALAGVPFRSQQPFSPNETASPSSRNSIMLPCTQGRRQGQERVCGGHGPASATAPTRWPLHASATASALAQVCRPRYNSSFANVSTLFQSQDLFKACKCRPAAMRFLRAFVWTFPRAVGPCRAPRASFKEGMVWHSVAPINTTSTPLRSVSCVSSKRGLPDMANTAASTAESAAKPSHEASCVVGISRVETNRAKSCLW